MLTHICPHAVNVSLPLPLPPGARSTVALLHNPALVVLDEPTTGLDPVLRHKLWRCLEEMATQGVTVIVTTHYVEEATSAHRVGLIRQGRLMDEGDPRQLIQKYRYVLVHVFGF